MPTRKTAALHRGRLSIPGATYFATGCIAGRRPVLAGAHGAALRSIWTELEWCGDAETLAATVMPDHFHWLFTLGERLTLGRVLAKFKVQSGRLWNGRIGEWQRDYFEHRLRENESSESYGFYVFMNPYRSNLIRADQAWPGWHCPRPERFRFTAVLDAAGRPPPQWLDLPPEDGLHVCE
ncbi:MAG: transposase [Candidatus Didemnitutus sp.]|nr:transposase [Candidatus Didemnitutus sp.]